MVPVGGIEAGGGGTAVSPALLTPALGIAIVALLGALALMARRSPSSYWGRRRLRAAKAGPAGAAEADRVTGDQLW